MIYPSQGYVVQGYPAVPPGQPYVGPDGLTYVNGVPVYFAEGAYYPLAFVAGLGWGYYDYGHRWFGAPGPLFTRLNGYYPGGRGFPGGGFRGGPGRPEFGGPGYHGGPGVQGGPGFHGGPDGRGGGFERR